MAPRICVLGSVNLDLVIQTKTLPKAGQTIGGGTYSAQPGGKGANIALAAKRLGADVELRAAIGGDDFANQALINLKREGVDLSALCIKDDCPTGLAFINVSGDGENQIAVAAGANGAFTPDDLTPITTDALITQFEIPQETVLTALKEVDGFRCLNASPVIDDLTPFLPYTDLLIVNEHEAEAYAKALENYAGLLAVTLGEQGARLEKSGNILAQAKPPEISAMDTTGAGDSFAAALTVAFLEKQSFEAALKFACAVGALTTTKIGAQSASPTRKSVDRILKQD